MNDNFKINVGNPIDSRYLTSTNQPYASISAVNLAIAESQRYVGLTVNINNVEYWYKEGVADGNLVIKDSGTASTGVTSAYNGITKEANAVKLGGTLTGETIFTKSGTGSLLKYAADYSGEYDAQTIPDAAYVTGITSSIESNSVTGARNGLTKDGQDVKLGGTLSENTTIDGNSGSYDLCLLNLKLVYFTFDSGVLIRDNSGLGYGLSYDDDYSSTFGDCSLVSKKYVDNEINILTGTTSQAITGASNGLTKTEQDVCLGGTLSTDTVINLNNGNCFQLCDTGNNADYIFDKDRVSLINNSSSLNISNTGDDYTLTHCSGSNVDLSLSGLTYGGDYSSNFKPNTLVTKDYVDNVTGGIDANNGLSRSGNNIVLGGALTGDTTIGDGSNNLYVNTTNFSVGSSNANINTSGGCLILNAVAGGTFKWNNINSCFSVDTKNVSFSNGVEGTSFLFDGDATVVGFYYGDDYTTGGTPTDRWLTDKGYVDTAITTTAITGATNGLGTDGQDICLGGTLTKNTCIDTNNSYGVAIGCGVQATGNNSFAIGCGSVCATGNESFAGGFGYYGGVKAIGTQSFAFGGDYTCNCGNNSVILGGNRNEISNGSNCSGIFVSKNSCAFSPHSTVIGGQTNRVNSLNSSILGGSNNQVQSPYSVILGGADGYLYGNNSAIIAGNNNNIGQNNHCSVIIGGDNINVASSSLPNHAIVPSLAIWDTPSAGSATTDAVLVWNSTDRKVKQVSAANLGEDNNIYDMTIVTSDVTLTTGSTYVQLVNSPTSGVTVTLPANPLNGQVFRIKDAASAALDYNITIARNGKLIDNGTNDGILNTDGGAHEVVYNNTLGSWFVFSFIN